MVDGVGAEPPGRGGVDPGDEGTGGEDAGTDGEVMIGLLSGAAGLGVELETSVPDKVGVASGVGGGVAWTVEVVGAMPGPNKGCVAGAGAGPVLQALFCVGQLREQVPFTMAAYVG